MRKFNISNAESEIPKETQDLLDKAKSKQCSPDQEIIHLKAIRNGNISAIKIIINANELSIINESVRLQKDQVSLLELIDAGKESLETMLLKYADSDELFKQYVSFSGWWIKQGIEKYCKESKL